MIALTSQPSETPIPVSNFGKVCALARANVWALSLALLPACAGQQHTNVYRSTADLNNLIRPVNPQLTNPNQPNPQGPFLPTTPVGSPNAEGTFSHNPPIAPKGDNFMTGQITSPGPGNLMTDLTTVVGNPIISDALVPSNPPPSALLPNENKTVVIPSVPPVINVPAEFKGSSPTLNEIVNSNSVAPAQDCMEVVRGKVAAGLSFSTEDTTCYKANLSLCFDRVDRARTMQIKQKSKPNKRARQAAATVSDDSDEVWKNTCVKEYNGFIDHMEAIAVQVANAK